MDQITQLISLVTFLVYLWNDKFVFYKYFRNKLSIAIAKTSSKVKSFVYSKLIVLNSCYFCQSFWLSLISIAALKYSYGYLLTSTILSSILYRILSKL